MIFCRTCLAVAEDCDCPPPGYVDTFSLKKDNTRLKAIQECRDMFVVNSVSWNLLNEKLKGEKYDEDV